MHATVIARKIKNSRVQQACIIVPEIGHKNEQNLVESLAVMIRKYNNHFIDRVHFEEGHTRFLSSKENKGPTILRYELLHIHKQPN